MCACECVCERECVYVRERECVCVCACVWVCDCTTSDRGNLGRRNTDAAGEWRGNPYIKSHAWATDAEGFARLMAQKGVFRCHKNKWDNRYHSDAGAALTILRSGWTIDSLMSRYQGVDWRSPATWQCNQRVPPDYENHYDGISINPYEVVFVPVKAASAASQWSFVEQADRYEKWLDLHLRQGEVDKEIQTNAWITKHWQYKHPKLVLMNARGPECFDFDHYIEVCCCLWRLHNFCMSGFSVLLLLFMRCRIIPTWRNSKMMRWDYGSTLS